MPPKRKSQTNAGISPPGRRRRLTVNWSAADEAHLEATLDQEVQVWRRVKDLYQDDAFNIIPPGKLVSFGAILPAHLEQMVNTNWNQRASMKFLSVLALPIFKDRLDILHHCISMVNYRRIRYSAKPATRHLVPNKPVWIGNLPEHVKGLVGKIDEALQYHNREYKINTGISVPDLEVITEAWDLYVESKPESGLQSTKTYQKSARLPRKSAILVREEVLGWKMDYILECRMTGRAYNQPYNLGQSAGMDGEDGDGPADGMAADGMADGVADGMADGMGSGSLGGGSDIADDDMEGTSLRGAGTVPDMGGGRDSRGDGNRSTANVQTRLEISDNEDSSTHAEDSDDSQFAGTAVSDNEDANVQGRIPHRELSIELPYGIVHSPSPSQKSVPNSPSADISTSGTNGQDNGTQSNIQLPPIFNTPGTSSSRATSMTATTEKLDNVASGNPTPLSHPSAITTGAGASALTHDEQPGSQSSILQPSAGATEAGTSIQVNDEEMSGEQGESPPAPSIQDLQAVIRVCRWIISQR
ncbi:hypothetical protein MFRU_036g00800 [Monilinia fructicola]|nr:hypothetical protein MFRU_036g00800 [Monilinia fructicola]